MLRIYDFSIEYVKNAKLVPVQDLRFGWKLESDHENVMQTAYRIVVRPVNRQDAEPAGGAEGSGREMNCTAIDTQKVLSPCHIEIKIPDLHLRSCTEYCFELTVWDNQGEEVRCEHRAVTEILPEEWEDARWIRPARYITGWAPYLRTKFVVADGVCVQKALLYASGLGIAEYYINGKRTDDFYLDPPVSNYDRVVYYRCLDVTGLICAGGNALAVLLGDGSYSQSIVWEQEERLGPDVHHGIPYGKVCVKLKLLLYLDDGSVQEIVTNTEDWKVKYSPVTSNNMYAGEIYDARLETPDFAEYTGEEWGWEPVAEDDTPKGTLKPCLMPPVRVIRELPAVSFQGSSGPGDGTWVADIGENIAGTAEYRLPRAPRGSVVTFRYTETLNQAGSPDHRSAGGAATQCIQQDIYICRGDGKEEVYRPRFGYHGFRYVEITGTHDVSEGYGTVPKLSVVKGLQLSTDMERTGDFCTDYEPLNRLQQLMHNTYRSNFHGIPEDCPAREKCGWLGDAQIVVNWGLYNYDSVASYEKYLEDIRTTVESFGTWKMISPGKRTCGNATPLWGCAQIVIPYYLYKYCGDRDAVLKNMDLMKAWIDHEERKAEDWLLTEGLGDWCPPGGEKNPRRIPVTHSSSMAFYEICRMMEELCEESERYRMLAEKIRESVNQHFYDYDTHTYGYWGSDGAALALGIYPDGEKEALLQSLVNRIRQDDYEMPTGIFANKYLVPVLMDGGYGDLAFRFLFHQEHPSFQRMLEEGATTIWECFDCHLTAERDGSVPSYNHPMHGGFLYSCHHDLAGIRPLKPGFEQFVFRPCFTECAGYVKAGYNAACGRIEAELQRTEEGWYCRLTVPAGSQAVAELPAGSRTAIKLPAGGQAAIGLSAGVPYKTGELLGSGVHEFFVPITIFNNNK